MGWLYPHQGDIRRAGAYREEPREAVQGWFGLKPPPRQGVVSTMGVPDRAGRPQVFSPLARALLDRFSEAVILFDPEGRMMYTNRGGQDLLETITGGGALDTRTLLPRLGRMGGRIERLVVGDLTLGNAVFVPGARAAERLETREREAIVGTLHATGWRLTETARRLGISRTTLWRRLRDWGIEAPANGDTE